MNIILSFAIDASKKSYELPFKFIIYPLAMIALLMLLTIIPMLMVPMTMLMCLLVMVIFPLITLPARVTAVSSTIIDHLITNNHKNYTSPVIIKTGFTDRYPIFCFIDVVNCSDKTNQKIFRRDFLNFNAENFCYDLHNALAAFGIRT